MGRFQSAFWHFGVEREGSWTDSVLSVSSFSHLQADALCLSAVSWVATRKQEASGVSLMPPEEPVFSGKITLPSTCLCHFPPRVCDSKKRKKYVNTELHENTMVCLFQMCSFYWLSVGFLFGVTVLLHLGNQQ